MEMSQIIPHTRSGWQVHSSLVACPKRRGGVVADYMTFSLNQQEAGSVVEVKLHGVESDVFLVDPSNLSSFKRGASFRYTGGHFKQSPVRLQVPSDGNWSAVVVPIGGRVEASVSILPNK